MNVYDTANKLAGEIKQSEEYMNYKMAKQALNLNYSLKERLAKFEKLRYEEQLEMMQTGKKNEQKEYEELIEDEEARRYFDAETKFNILIADVNKIIGDTIKDVME